MSKKTASDSVADQIATFIGKSMGELLNKKESLQRQLAEVEKQIAGVRKKVLKQFGGAAKTRRKAKSALKRAGKVDAPRTVAGDPPQDGHRGQETLGQGAQGRQGRDRRLDRSAACYV